MVWHGVCPPPDEVTFGAMLLRGTSRDLNLTLDKERLDSRFWSRTTATCTYTPPTAAGNPPPPDPTSFHPEPCSHPTPLKNAGVTYLRVVY